MMVRYTDDIYYYIMILYVVFYSDLQIIIITLNHRYDTVKALRALVQITLPRSSTVVRLLIIICTWAVCGSFAIFWNLPRARQSRRVRAQSYSSAGVRVAMTSTSYKLCDNIVVFVVVIISAVRIMITYCAKWQ